MQIIQEIIDSGSTPHASWTVLHSSLKGHQSASQFIQSSAVVAQTLLVHPSGEKETCPLDSIEIKVTVCVGDSVTGTKLVSSFVHKAWNI